MNWISIAERRPGSEQLVFAKFVDDAPFTFLDDDGIEKCAIADGQIITHWKPYNMRTNGDIIRKMTDHEIAAALSDAVRSGIAGGQNDTYKQWLEWLKKEAEP